MWPWQLLVMLEAMLGKPDGGERGVALIPWILRLWGQLRRGLGAGWCDEQAGFWDQAIKGSNALQVAVQRLFWDESAEILGFVHGSLLWDFAEFYDSLDPVHALRCALQLRFPARVVGMSAATYLAPRLLRSRGAVSAPIHPTASLLTGESSANNYARAVLYDMLDAVHREHLPRYVHVRQ